MSSRSSFVRKIIYLVAIAVLLMPLFWLSQPATNAVKGVQGSPGGKLAQLRDEYHLSQAQLGQIDPTSVTIKLATLGMRGVAANILWEKANDYKMKKDWTNFGATLNQITKVQPNFINVWSNQAWNLSYNVSVEFDDYRERYRWVIKGIDFLKEGIKYNERQPRLLWDMGWMISQKIGKADESKQFRKLFKEDDDFHGARPVALRDNWLVGKEWFERGGRTWSIRGREHDGQEPADLPLQRPDVPDVLRRGPGEGRHLRRSGQGGVGRRRRRVAPLRRRGNPHLVHGREDQEPIVIRLNEEEMHERSRQEARRPARRHAARACARRSWPRSGPPDREPARGPRYARRKTHRQAVRAGRPGRRGHQGDARRGRPQSRQGPKREEAVELAKEAAEHEEIAGYIRRYREIVNFVYWRLRAEVEQTDDMLGARRLIHQGDRAYSRKATW